MREIKAINGKMEIPKEFLLSKNKRRLTIKMPWKSEVECLNKNDFTTSIQMWFRNKDKGDKPYIPEGFIEFDGVRFKVKEVKKKK